MRIEGQLLDGAGEPVPDGLVELWGGQQFKRCRTDSEGVFHFTVVKPAAGVEAPHLDVTIFARGLLRHLATRMYFPDEETANASDRVLNLIDPWIGREARPGGRTADQLASDIVDLVVDGVGI